MTFHPTLPAVFAWESQAPQYPALGTPGVSYFPGPVPGVGVVDCLLFRDHAGALIGILNHYPFDAPPWESKGNVNIWVRADRQRRGIGTALWKEAVRRWGVTLDGQRFTVAGAALANHLNDK